MDAGRTDLQPSENACDVKVDSGRPKSIAGLRMRLKWEKLIALLTVDNQLGVR